MSSLIRTLCLISLLAAPATAATTSGSRPAGQPAGPADQIEAAGLTWHTDYYDAYREAVDGGRMMLVNLTSPGSANRQQSVDDSLAADEGLRDQLTQMTLLRAPADTKIDVAGKPQSLARLDGFGELGGGAGFVIIDLKHADAPYFRHAVTVLPYAGGKYYQWSVRGLRTAVDLPPGTLTQRSLVWAVRMHPEAPQSTGGQFHPALAAGAKEHASYQARVRQQGHQNFERRFHRLSAAAGSSVTEVCAESWPRQSLMDSVVDCVASWRHSSGHWRGVSRPHRAYGYDIKRGANGIWYATGLFSD